MVSQQDTGRHRESSATKPSPQSRSTGARQLTGGAEGDPGEGDGFGGY